MSKTQDGSRLGSYKGSYMGHSGIEYADLDPSCKGSCSTFVEATIVCNPGETSDVPNCRPEVV